MKYLFILLVLAIVIIPAVSAIRRFRSLTFKDIDFDVRVKELKELAEKERQTKGATEETKEEPKQES